MVNELHIAQLNKTNNQPNKKNKQKTKKKKKKKNKATKNNFLSELQKQYLTILNSFF